MALSVEFGLTATLTAALDAMRDDPNKYRSVVVTFEGETLTAAGEPIAATADVAADLAQVRSTLSSIPAGFVVMALDGKLSLVTVSPEGVKPRMRMMLATASSKLRDDKKLAAGPFVDSVANITPELFGHKSQPDMRSAEEIRKEDAKKQFEQEQAAQSAAPRMHAMHGIAAQLTPDATAALKAVAAGERNTAVLAVEESAIALVGDVDHIDQLTVTDVPRFAYTRCQEKAVLLYAVPEGGKPKVKMQYSLTKQSLVGQLKTLGCTIDKSVETSVASGFADVIGDALNAHPTDAGSEAESKPEAPAQKSFMKGPRMFMP